MNKVISEFTLQLVLKPEGLNYESDSLLLKRILTEKDRKYSIIPAWSWLLRKDPHDSWNSTKVNGRTNENWVKFLHIYYY